MRPLLRLLPLLAIIAALAAETAEEHAAARSAEIAEYVAWTEQESGWFTIRHPDPREAVRSEPAARICQDLAQVLNANAHLLPARKAVLMETLLDPTVNESVRFALAGFLSGFSTTVGLDHDERLRVDGITYGLLAYDYSRAIAHLTRVVLSDFRGQATATVGAALRAAGWPLREDDLAYVMDTVIPSVRVE